MKRDSIYYQIFKRFPALIFELVDYRPEQAQNYRFESVEVKETAFTDGIFLPPEGATPRIIFFAEVQFQKVDSRILVPLGRGVSTLSPFTNFRKFCREEVEAMLGLNIEETRIYQDLERQTKLKAAARFLSMGYSISEVAKAVDLSVEEVTTEVVNYQTHTEQDIPN